MHHHEGPAPASTIDYHLYSWYRDAIVINGLIHIVYGERFLILAPHGQAVCSIRWFTIHSRLKVPQTPVIKYMSYMNLVAALQREYGG